MLRPATILSIFVFAAFALLLIATLSTPVIKGIPLGSVDDVTFGVFGYCGPNSCSDFAIGYDPSEFLKASDSNFDLPSSVRDSLTTILIVHPIAAFLTLGLFAMSVAAHFHAPGHSTKYHLIVFIFSVLDFLVCLLAFIVDVLLFVPHLGWASYLVIAGTVLVALSSLFVCVMRRTLISRKDRKKRIDENAEMSGENYYNREAQKSAIAMTRQPTMPSVTSGANGPGDSLPRFATFESGGDEKPSEERIPLTQRSPSERSAHLARANTVSPVNPVYGEPMRSNTAPSQEQYGNPMGPSPDDYSALRRGPSVDNMGSRGRGRGGGPPPGYRGVRGSFNRGGYGGPGRGGYGPPGRGGYGPRGAGYGGPRGGPGGMMRGGGRPPYQGYQNGAGSYDRRPPPGNGYGGYRQGSNDPYNAATAPGNGYGAYGSAVTDLPRAESPPTMSAVPSAQPGMAVEIDGTPAGHSTNPLGTIRDSDTDVEGMVGLQRGVQHTDSYMSDGSRYSTDDNQSQYVPPRAGWNHAAGRHSPSVPSPLAIGRNPQAQGQGSSSPDNGVAYYEDVDPRYAGESGGRARSPQWGGFPGGRPAAQGSNPDFRTGGGLSPPPAQRGGYSGF